MISDKRLSVLPVWITKSLILLKKRKFSRKIGFILVSLFATFWFLYRVISKPSRALYPCMQVASPLMSGFIIWILSLSGTIFAFKKVRQKLLEARYTAAGIFLVVAIAASALLTAHFAKSASAKDLEIWYKPNVPHGIARGNNPGRVSWGHNPKIASWDGNTGFWWEDNFNNQEETNKLFSSTLFTLTQKNNENEAWNVLFIYFNHSKRNQDRGYTKGEKVTIKINENNTYSHESNNEINANPQLILSLLTSLTMNAGVPQENITVTDPSRYITNNIYDKCHAVFPKVHYVDHNGGDGREKTTFIPGGFRYSFDFERMESGLASCMTEANYIINLAIMKGHVSQGVSLCAKNFFGCTSIETDWHKNAHCSGFSQNREGKRTYSVYPDFMGHKDLGEKTMLFLIDGIYSNKFVDKTPAFKWKLAPFNNQWPCSLFASQDGVAIESVVLDFALAEWPDAPDMKYSDYYLEESALADNPPSGTVYDPERSGKHLKSLGVTEHWNNPVDKKYSRNLKSGNGIELVYSLVE